MFMVERPADMARKSGVVAILVGIFDGGSSDSISSSVIVPPEIFRKRWISHNFLAIIISYFLTDYLYIVTEDLFVLV